MLVRTIKGAALALLALIVATPAFAADLSFTGQVTYRERMALPANAELWVTLVSVPDQTPIASAAAALPARSQVPLHYALNVRSAVVRPTGAYGLIAEIRAEGQTLFRNWQPIEVQSGGQAGTQIQLTFTPPPPHLAPEQILPPPETPNPLVDIVWTVTSIGGDPILPQSKVTLSIAGDQRVGGSGGCNSYFTEADFAGPPLTFSPIAGTRMACDPAVMAQEGRFFAALDATAGYELAGNALKLVDAAGVPLVGLVRQP